MSVRRAWTGSAALVVVLALAACEESPEAGTVDPPTATESESSEPETTEPTEPETTDPGETTEPAPELTEVAGEEPEVTFAKHFYDLYNYALRTGDVAPLAAISDPACRNCMNVVSWIEDVYGAGGHIEGGQYELVDDPVFAADSDPPEVRLTFREDALTLVESAKADPKTTPACDALRHRMELKREEEGWVVAQYHVRTPCV